MTKTKTLTLLAFYVSLAINIFFMFVNVPTLMGAWVEIISLNILILISGVSSFLWLTNGNAKYRKKGIWCIFAVIMIALKIHLNFFGKSSIFIQELDFQIIIGPELFSFPIQVALIVGFYYWNKEDKN